MPNRQRSLNDMQYFLTNDGVEVAYLDLGVENGEPLVLLHGFTGSSEVWKRIIPSLQDRWRIIAPDLRGHGHSGKPTAGYHVSRLAMDLQNLIDHLKLQKVKIRCIAGSLGCAILWSHSELFTSQAFSHMVWVDQSPLQNYTADGLWDSRLGNRSCNSDSSLAHMQATLKYQPEEVYRGTIAACLAYRSHPLPDEKVSAETWASDEEFFLGIAKQGNAEWFGKLMANHTSLDWRDSLRTSFGPGSGSMTRILVVASERSGCFPAQGPLEAVKLVDSPAVTGIAITWGGHWCYWESPEKFNSLMANFLET